jgi:23S rRNA pseudouridine1911/1915/1917 synthase
VSGIVRAVVERNGERLDIAVARVAGVTRSRAARLVDDGAVSVNGGRRARAARLESGDVLEIALPDDPAPPAPEPIEFRVVFEDEWLAVISKPAGLVVHPAPGHPTGTLVNALLARAGRPLPGDADRPGIVHRLDAGTSGLMIVALEETAHDRLRALMTAHEVERTYLALVEGSPPANATVDAPIGRSPRHRKKMAVVAGGKEAVTTFRRLEAFPDCALLEVRPQTGRTHQIRVHLATTGYPVIGDRVYGRDRKLAVRLGLARQFLHAAGLAFVHPMTGEDVTLEDPMPPDLEAALEILRRA